MNLERSMEKADFSTMDWDPVANVLEKFYALWECF